MLRYHSTGVTTLVALMAAHRLAAQARPIAVAAAPPVRGPATSSAHATAAEAVRQQCHYREPSAGVRETHARHH